MCYTTFDTILSSLRSNLPGEVQATLGEGSDLPKRCFIQRPFDNGAFILPIKQSFMKDARLMPGTRCMLALLVGWAGKGRGLELTQARIAKHIGRSVRQVYRYLKDAADNGYLTYNYTKTRIGMITGIKIFLNFSILRANKEKDTQTPEIPARTQKANTNKNSILNNNYDPEIEARLASFAKAMRVRHKNTG
ncbi:MAG: helix-turn-helix domain-containing protein [Sneathiellales bacterium]|nr:helix-turn-helix domain-containing protein [Sneathiellales bacterium]